MRIMKITDFPSQSKVHPIFIVGAPRSGTTLVARILGQHQDVASLGESHFFEDIWSRRSEIGELQTEAELAVAVDRTLTLFGRYAFSQTQRLVERVFTKEALIEQVHMLGGGYGALYYALMLGLAHSVGKSRFCDDTPKHLYYLDTILSLFPQAKVVACVRDPRDFLSSYKNYWKKMVSEYEVNRVKSLYHPVLTSFLWHSSANMLQKYNDQHYRECVTLVQYEKLVTNPIKEVHRICDFVVFEYSDKLLQVRMHNSSFEQTSEGIFTTSVGRWRTSLSQHEIWLVQTLNRRTMRVFGYQAKVVSPSFKDIFFTFASSPVAFIKALEVNTARRGPVLGYIWRRLMALWGR